MSFKQSFKTTFQPLEIATKRVLGIKKLKKGRLFDKSGFIADGREKLTRYALFVPFYQRIQTIVGVNEFTNSAVKTGGGGGDSLVECHSGDDREIHAYNPTNPNAHLYTIRTIYRVFGIPLFRRTYTKIQSISYKTTKFTPYVHYELAKYIATNPNIEQEIHALISGLSPANQAFVLRQIGRCRRCYDAQEWAFTSLTPQEQNEWKKISTEFLPNIHKLGENLYCYKHYLLPTSRFEISVFWHRHSLEVLEKSTLARMRGKDIVDVGGYVGDSTLIFQDFTDKNIYTFEPTKENYERILRTIKLNNLKRVIPINKGLGAENSKAEIGISGEFGLGSSIVFADACQSKESIEITTLDEFVAERKIEVGFIKVDIEGFEMEFLKGAKNTICAQKPAMLISIYHQPSDYFGIKPLIESWNLGYSFKIHQGIDYGLTVETALFCEVLE